LKLHWVKPRGLCERSAALGTFDGVHIGHRRLIRAAADGKPPAGCSTVFTFDYPPEQVFTGNIQLICDFRSRKQLLFEAGIDEVVWAPFNQELAGKPPEQFIEDILIRALRVNHVVCGYNFRFGHQARGTPDMLKDFGDQHGFEVNILSPVMVDGRAVSSTRIRQCLLRGDIAEAAQLLNRYPAYRGTVAAGAGRGRKLGFPTANLTVEDEVLIPQDAVYLTWSILDDGRSIPSVTAISTNPTFNGERRTIESFLLDFQGDLYHHDMELQFLAKLRDIRRYDSAEDLRRQISADVDEARMRLDQLRLHSGRIVLE